MTDETAKHAIPPPPATPRRLRKKPSPLPWRNAECDFSDEPTEIRRVAEPVARAVREQLERPWWHHVGKAVLIAAAAGAVAWAGGRLIDGSTNDAVHETQISDLSKRVDRIETSVSEGNDKLDQVLQELRRR